MTASHCNETPTDDLSTNSPDLTADSFSSGSGHKARRENVSSKPDSSSASDSRVEKRKANTMAARRYRQKRLDRISELESALKATQLERDALKVQVAKLQGETHVLKDLVHGSTGRGNGGSS